MFELKDIQDNNDQFLFFRIVEKCYADNLVKKGQIRFGLLETYRTMGKNNLMQIGDCYEACLTKQVSEYIGIDGVYHEIHGPKAGYNVRINANQCAFCCYYAGLKDFESLGNNHYKFVLSSSDVEMLCKDKGGAEKCCLAVFDENVESKICYALNERKLSFKSGKVAYDDYDYVPEHNIHSREYALECAFHKNKEYSYQREYRIAVLNDKKEAINDFFIPIEETDFSLLELKSGRGVKCDIQVDPCFIDNMVFVAFHIQLSLE